MFTCVLYSDMLMFPLRNKTPFVCVFLALTHILTQPKIDVSVDVKGYTNCEVLHRLHWLTY